MNSDHDSNASILKLVFVWVFAAFSSITLNQWLGVMTLIYTVIQIIISVKKLRQMGRRDDSDEDR